MPATTETDERKSKVARIDCGSDEERQALERAIADDAIKAQLKITGILLGLKDEHRRRVLIRAGEDVGILDMSVTR